MSNDLTKDDFSIHQHDNKTAFVYLDNYNPIEMIDQILKNQEKAKTYDELKERLDKYGEVQLIDELQHTDSILARRQKNQDIVESLKEYYEGAKRNDYNIDKELCIIFQKILEGKK